MYIFINLKKLLTNLLNKTILDLRIHTYLCWCNVLLIVYSDNMEGLIWKLSDCSSYTEACWNKKSSSFFLWRNLEQSMLKYTHFLSSILSYLYLHQVLSQWISSKAKYICIESSRKWKFVTQFRTKYGEITIIFYSTHQFGLANIHLYHCLFVTLILLLKSENNENEQTILRMTGIWL